jgi:phosphate transport system substrate-binding protein
MTTIADAWTAECRDSTLNYTPGGTDFGLQQFAAGETDFAVADHALGANDGEVASVAARCAGVGASANKDLVLQLPLVLTPVVLTYHLAGVDELRLDAPALTAIFSGRLTKWNDKTVAELNPGVRLPAKAITVIARADRAVTTQTLQEYLTAVGGWRSGSGPEFTGKSGQAQRSDADVLVAVRSIDGAIGYLPNTLARPTGEPVVMLAAGTLATAPDSAAVIAAVDSALADTDDLTRLPAAIYRAHADEAGIGTVPYPLVHVGYLVACTQYPDAGTVAAVRDFLFTALGMQVDSARGYQLPFGELRSGLVDLVRQTY